MAPIRPLPNGNDRVKCVAGWSNQIIDGAGTGAAATMSKGQTPARRYSKIFMGAAVFRNRRDHAGHRPKPARRFSGSWAVNRDASWIQGPLCLERGFVHHTLPICRVPTSCCICNMKSARRGNDSGTLSGGCTLPLRWRHSSHIWSPQLCCGGASRCLGAEPSSGHGGSLAPARTRAGHPARLRLSSAPCICPASCGSPWSLRSSCSPGSRRPMKSPRTTSPNCRSPPSSRKMRSARRITPVTGRKTVRVTIDPSIRSRPRVAATSPSSTRPPGQPTSWSPPRI